MKKLLVFVIIILAIWFMIANWKKAEETNENKNIDVSSFVNYSTEDVKIEKIEMVDSKIKGTIRNIAGKERHLVTISFKGYYSDGTESSLVLRDSTEDLGIDQTWDFEIDINDRKISKLDKLELVSY